MQLIGLIMSFICQTMLDVTFEDTNALLSEILTSLKSEHFLPELDCSKLNIQRDISSVEHNISNSDTRGNVVTDLESNVINSSFSKGRDLSYSLEDAFRFTPTEIFNSAVIKETFTPLIQKLFNHNEGFPFQAPVDPVVYNIPDYFDIIKHPMDLSTILNRLQNEFYVDPWEVIHDVCQMFQNAWTYNRRTTRIFKMTSRLSQYFSEISEPVMKELGLCCSYRRVFLPQMLYCIGKDYCVIQRNAPYYQYQSYYIYCQNCFDDIKFDNISLIVEEDNDDDHDHENNQTGSTTKLVPKSEFIKEFNSKIYMEPFVECICCKRRLHQICMMHSVEIHGNKFYCPLCVKKFNYKYPENKYTSKKLKETHLSSFIEQKVNEMLQSKDSTISHVNIRLLYNNVKQIETKAEILEKFPGKYPKAISYKSKALFAFQNVDDHEICFFGMQVQEFGNDVPEPNKGRVYIGYLDSVHFFQPKHLKTDVYYTILSSYFEYVMKMGFSYVHIWSCPPCDGDDYIFHCHPVEQKIPKHKRLTEWYRILLDKNLKSKTFSSVKDLHRYIMREKRGDITQIPYFDGDYWPNAFEDIINEVKSETKESLKNSRSGTAGRSTRMLMRYLNDSQSDENEDVEEIASNNNKTYTTTTTNNNNNNNSSDCNVMSSNGKNQRENITKKRKRVNKKNKNTKKSNISKSSRKKPSQLPVAELTVEERLLGLLEKFKDVFFVCKLNSQIAAVSEDSNPIIHSDLTDGRSGILQLCRERKWEFSTLKRTMFATMGLLVELHVQFDDRIVYTCNICKRHLFKKYHCTTCSDFDLCDNCFSSDGHSHEMIQIDDSMESQKTLVEKFLSSQTEINFDQKISFDGTCTEDGSSVASQLLRILVHASHCEKTDLNEPCDLHDKCQKMRHAIHHVSLCNVNDRLKCQVCHSLMSLCIPHAKNCKLNNCNVVFCDLIKARIGTNVPTRHGFPGKIRNRDNIQNTRRRMAAMLEQENSFNVENENNSSFQQPKTEISDKKNSPFIRQHSNYNPENYKRVTSEFHQDNSPIHLRDQVYSKKMSFDTNKITTNNQSLLNNASSQNYSNQASSKRFGLSKNDSFFNMNNNAPIFTGCGANKILNVNNNNNNMNPQNLPKFQFNNNQQNFIGNQIAIPQQIIHGNQYVQNFNHQILNTAQTVSNNDQPYNIAIHNRGGNMNQNFNTSQLPYSQINMQPTTQQFNHNQQTQHAVNQNVLPQHYGSMNAPYSNPSQVHFNPNNNSIQQVAVNQTEHLKTVPEIPFLLDPSDNPPSLLKEIYKINLNKLLEIFSLENNINLKYLGLKFLALHPEVYFHMPRDLQKYILLVLKFAESNQISIHSSLQNYPSFKIQTMYPENLVQDILSIKNQQHRDLVSKLNYLMETSERIQKNNKVLSKLVSQSSCEPVKAIMRQQYTDIIRVARSIEFPQNFTDFDEMINQLDSTLISMGINVNNDYDNDDNFIVDDNLKNLEGTPIHHHNSLNTQNKLFFNNDEANDESPREFSFKRAIQNRILTKDMYSSELKDQMNILKFQNECFKPSNCSFYIDKNGNIEGKSSKKDEDFKKDSSNYNTHQDVVSIIEECTNLNNETIKNKSKETEINLSEKSETEIANHMLYEAAFKRLSSIDDPEKRKKLFRVIKFFNKYLDPVKKIEFSKQIC